jgi:hypothetical protein
MEKKIKDEPLGVFPEIITTSDIYIYKTLNYHGAHGENSHFWPTLEGGWKRYLVHAAMPLVRPWLQPRSQERGILCDLFITPLSQGVYYQVFNVFLE